MPRFLQSLILSLIATLGITSSGSAFAPKTALRADRQFSFFRVGANPSYLPETPQQNTLGYGAFASDSPLASRGLTATEKAITQLASKLRFTGTTAAHMAETGRYVPRHILADAILTGKRMPDPQGAPGAVKIVQDVVINQKNRVLEIIYRESDSTILHFLYK
jgi:hypothetical protein